MMSLIQPFLSVLLLVLATPAFSLNIVIAGGTGKVGQKLASSYLLDHDVTILCRNAFLAAAPSRVSGDFGWVGQSFLDRNPHVTLRDYDGGDLLDIVGQDWVGWQEDALKPANVVLNLVGGFTKQREMATERIVRESLKFNPAALQITVSPKEEELKIFSPGMYDAKVARLALCEEMVRENCHNSACLRVEYNDLENTCKHIMDVIIDREGLA
mmetsp:Transcript_14171/g.25686  ORF Transcript_14171/g.25686 Transcript_14171/m.25686 type:complete len:213 (-) Transcript_14171:9-647(-)|eukprot:CAMPEP_0198283364 /NCGR_PEP_ID=MMETSP1449-20131203/2980_1 /TAXON_ID=420275 /ORGANISM="Attheya septentrionalis, Strain CCMP2084" /LENGTH=212 /DNA_ID=CAMNT_0043979949 /DNA_START=100 /DNA_END=738 /DNA_ORIENTATION=+